MFKTSSRRKIILLKLVTQWRDKLQLGVIRFCKQALELPLRYQAGAW